jgi:hypothetical protein
MQYLFDTPIPIPWLLADLLTLLVTVIVMVFVVQKSKHPVAILLESCAFVFLYAGVYENFAVVRGWYIYGHSLLMLGDVPLAVPLLELDVLITVIWLMEKMDIPIWCKPFIAGLFGTLQDFSLDPYTWLLPQGAVNIYGVPVYNFPGWTLIMFYATTFILVGRWWYKRSGYKPIIGYLYPFLMIFFALLTMVSPISQFLLWLTPFFTKGSYSEWIMLFFHLIFPLALLAIFWHGRMKYHVTIKEDLPIFAVIGLFHLSDILFTIAGGYYEILWLVLLASVIHWGLLGWIFMAGRKVLMPKEEFFIGP